MTVDLQLDRTKPRRRRGDQRDAINLFLGIDIGGTKIEAAVVDQDGAVRASVRRATSADRGPEAVIAEVVSSAVDVLDQVPALVAGSSDGSGRPRVRGVGVGVAGQVDPATGAVRYAPNLGWQDVPLGQRLATALRLPVAVLNDVQAATFGEWVHGAGRGASGLVCLFFGTGVGGGLVIGGQLVRGCSGSAGELGHTIVDLDGRPCRGGHAGCLEAYAGGWAMARRAREAVAAAPAGGQVMLALAGNDPALLTAGTVVEAARQEDPMAAEIVRDVERALGAAAVSIVNALNPCTLLLGGGVVDGWPELVDVAHAAIQTGALPSAAGRVRVMRNGLARHAGAIGAAAWARWHGATPGASNGAAASSS